MCLFNANATSLVESNVISMEVKWSRIKMKLQLVTLLLLSLLSCSKCQKEVCGTRTSEAIDVMWMIHTDNDIESSDFLMLKQFLSDMMLWFRISSSNTDGTRHGCFIYGDTVQEISNYEISVEKAQTCFNGLKRKNTTDKMLDKIFDYVVKNTMVSDRQAVPNVAVFVITAQPTAKTIIAATNFTKSGWNIIFLVVTSEVDNDQIPKDSLGSQLNKNYYTVRSFRELKSSDFQNQFARAICVLGDYIEETKVKLKRNIGIKLGYVNVALKKPASQDTTTKQYIASKAVDGIKDRQLANGFCSETGTSTKDHWWKVDLQKKYDLEYVSIYHIFYDSWFQLDIIGHNGDDGKNSELCISTDDKYQAFISELFKCSNIMKQKRYVQIQRPGNVLKSNAMILCEVEIFTAWPPGYYNVAMNKETAESSASAGSSALAVDGNTSPRGRCAVTVQSQSKVWWEVDLKELYDIFGVTVFNSRNYFEGLKYFDISAYEELKGSERLKNELCGSIIDHKFSLKHFECELLQKRYILINKNKVQDRVTLSLCEVEVWTECKEGNYGRYCEELCKNCSGTCDKVTGECTLGIKDEEEEEVDTPEAQTSSSSGTVAGVVVFLLLVLVGVAVGGAIYYKRMNQRKIQKSNRSDQPDQPEDDPDQPPISFKWLWEKPPEEEQGQQNEIFLES